MIFCARATRGLGKPSLDTRSRRSISLHPWERTSELGGSMYIVRRAHSRIDQVAPVEGNEQAWMDQLDFVGRAQLVINPGHPSLTLILSLILAQIPSS